MTKSSRHGGKAARKGSATDSFCAWDGETLVLNILGQPGAKRDAIGKVKGDQLKVSVTAAPVAGRATDHMVRSCLKMAGVPALVADAELVQTNSLWAVALGGARLLVPALHAVEAREVIAAFNRGEYALPDTDE